MDHPTVSVEGRRVYVLTPYGHPAVARLKGLGARWDPERKAWWVGAAKRQQVEDAVKDVFDAPPEAEDPHSVRVSAKVKYRDRTCFVRAEGHGRWRIVTLDGKLDCWVEQADCELLKTYPPREERGAYGRPTGRQVYTTLGSIRDFVPSQERAKARGEERCPACGRFGPLVPDLEDGIDKCYRCCDMPEGRA